MPQTLETHLLEGRERFLRYIRSKVSDPDLAEDILQDSLLKALRAAPDLRDDERLVPWFYRVIRNGIVDAYCSKGKGHAHLLPLDDVDVPMEDEETAVLCDCFRSLLPALKPEYGELLDAELREEAPDMTAARLGITANNLKVRRHRARQALRVRLEETCRMCVEHGCLDCTCR